MFNKKILAAVVAASLSQAAFADVDVDAGTGSVKVATDSIAYEAAVVANANADNSVDLTTNGSVDNVDVQVGFSIASGANRFVRLDFTNATFDVAAADADLTIAAAAAGGAAASIAISTGGTVGSSFVVYEITDDNDIVQTDTFTFDVPNLRVNGTTATVQYRLYETGVAAVAGNSEVLADKTANVVEFGTANTGEFVTVETATATVTSSFTQFDPVAASATAFADADQARLGTVTPANLLGTNFIDLDGTAMTLAKLLDADQTLQFEGQFNFGADGWYLSANNDCSAATTAIVINADQDTGTIANYNVTTAGVQYLCVDVDGTETIVDQASNIEVTLTDDGVSDEAGQTDYDTTNIIVPLLTTFSGYNQRIFITNNGTTDANYTTTFTTEDGTTAVDGSAATGTVPAGEMIVIRATDLVTLTGTTRVNATIQIEAEESLVEAVTQTVNLGDSTTDTVVLVVDGPDADEI